MTGRYGIGGTMKTKLAVVGVVGACMAGVFAPNAAAINPQPLPPLVLPPTLIAGTQGIGATTVGVTADLGRK